jgi:hypothetical protein
MINNGIEAGGSTKGRLHSEKNERITSNRTFSNEENVL